MSSIRATAVLIVGPHRCGTSATSELLHTWGLWPATRDVDVAGDPHNPRGHWESRALVQLNDAMLAAVGCSWASAPLLEWDWPKRLSERPAWLKRCHAAATAAARDGDWAWKDPRLAVTLPLWAQSLPVPWVAVLVVRDPLDAAYSLHRRNAFPLVVGAALWTLSLAHALQTIVPERSLILHFEHLLHQPAATAAALHDWLRSQGIQRLSGPSTATLDRSLPHRGPQHTGSADPLPASCAACCQELYRRLRPEQAVCTDPETLLEAARWCGEVLPGPFPAAVVEALHCRIEQLSPKARGYEILEQHPVIRVGALLRRLWRRPTKHRH